MPESNTDGKTAAKAGAVEFAATFLDLDKGRVHDDAGDRLAEVVDGVSRYGGKGKLTITVEVEPLDPETFADTGVVTLSAKVDATVPRPKRGASVFFLDGTGGLTRDDPQRVDPRDRD